MGEKVMADTQGDPAPSTDPTKSATKKTIAAKTAGDKSAANSHAKKTSVAKGPAAKTAANATVKKTSSTPVTPAIARPLRRARAGKTPQSMAPAHDAYIRIPAGIAGLEREVIGTRPRHLVFVDLDAEPSDGLQALNRLTEASPGLFMDAGTLLIRAPIGSTQRQIEDLMDLASALSIDQVLPVSHAAILEIQIGQPRRLHWCNLSGTDNKVDPSDVFRRDIESRARGIELHALLEHGRCVWQPGGYHFRLPSGQHSEVLIRLGDAFRSSRDSVATASWLADLIRPGLAVLADSHSLTPLILGLQLVAAQAGLRIDRIKYLEHFPVTTLESEEAVRDTASGSSHVLALVSVSNHGTTLGQLQNALDNDHARYTAHVLVDRDRSANTNTMSAGSDDHTVDVWLGLKEHGAVRDEDSCPACRDRDHARVLRIDPRDMRSLALPEPTLVMPDIIDAQHNAPLWEACDRLGAVTLEGKADTPTEANRPRRQGSARMAVHIDMAKLIQDAPFRKVAAGLLQNDLEQSDRIEMDEERKLGTWLGAPDVVVVAEDDSNWPGIGQLRKQLLAVLGASKYEVVRFRLKSGDFSQGDAVKVLGAERVLIMAQGLVSGRSLQRMLVAVQNQKRGGSKYTLAGLVLHARPSSEREWQTLVNSFGGRLHPIFDCVLPIWGPLPEEGALLTRMEDLGAEELDEFVLKRSAIAQGRSKSVDGYLPVLWGAPDASSDATRVRQHSLFGHRIDLPTLFVAVGASVHRSRERAGRAGWFAFEMPAIVASYYDSLIIACLLRWTQAHEVWWGNRESEAATTVATVLGRASAEDLQILLPELLLALRLGKVPVSAGLELQSRARAILNSDSKWPEHAKVALRVAHDQSLLTPTGVEKP